MELKDRIIDKINETICEKNETPFPKKNLLIELTNYCNNKCVFCYNDCMKRQKQFINKELCERILNDAYNLGMREVGFYVIGEPFLDKRLSHFVSYAHELGYKYIYLTTNGILADLERVKELYANGLNSIKYSINAFNKEQYKFIHGTDNFDKVLKNLSDVFRWKNTKNKNLKVYVSYISIDITRNENKVRELFNGKCDEVVIMPAINQGGLIPDICKISTTNCSDINGNIKYPCPYPFNSIVVTAEGLLTACCMDFENMLAYADLNKISLKEAWNNSIISSFRKKHLKQARTGYICDNCIYNIEQIPVPLCHELCDSCKEIKFKKIKIKETE